MTKQTKEEEEPRRVGPKFARNVLPDKFQIRRPSSPMADLLDEADRAGQARSLTERTGASLTRVDSTPVKTAPVISDPVKAPVNSAANSGMTLPGLDDFL